uniref:Uncharacterized protein n=1 Tax=Solanum tuberosum TaxID=4113 RepID=M1DD42_SOLTU
MEDIDEASSRGWVPTDFSFKFLGINHKGVASGLYQGQNVWVRLPGTILRVPKEDPNPWPNKLPRQLENAHRESMSASRTSSTIGQKFGPHHGRVTDSSDSKFNFQKVVGIPLRRGLVSQRNL